MSTWKTKPSDFAAYLDHPHWTHPQWYDAEAQFILTQQAVPYSDALTDDQCLEELILIRRSPSYIDINKSAAAGYAIHITPAAQAARRLKLLKRDRPKESRIRPLTSRLTAANERIYDNSWIQKNPLSPAWISKTVWQAKRIGPDGLPLHYKK